MSRFWDDDRVRATGKFVREKALPELGSVFTITCVSLVGVLVILLLANWAASGYLRANPDILLSRAERINENTRSVREKMIPPDKIAEWYDFTSADELQPMWDEYYKAGAAFESYVHYRSRTLIGDYYGMREEGFRNVRDQGPWPLDVSNYNVFFFGGSTSFGVGPYWGTVASYLQEELNSTDKFGRPVKVYNFGRSGYHSNQEQILFHRLISDGHMPDAVVFLDGLNDFCFLDGQPSSWQMLARHFDSVNEQARARSSGEDVDTDWSELGTFISSMPLTRLIGAWNARSNEEAIPTYTGPEGAIDEPSPPAEKLNKVIDRYLGNIGQVQAVARANGIASYFVWQPIPTYKYSAEHHLFYPDRLGCHTGSKFGYPIMANRVEQGLNIESFIWAADMQEDLRENVYIDAFHYTAPFSRDIAKLIAANFRDHAIKSDVPGEAAQ
jgi:hypothetical protein